MTQRATETKISQLKARAYQLASKIAGHTISQPKQLKKRLGDGFDFRTKSSWVVAIRELEKMIARDVIVSILQPVAA